MVRHPRTVDLRTATRVTVARHPARTVTGPPKGADGYSAGRIRPSPGRACVGGIPLRDEASGLVAA
ncbi:hypothetical protein PSA01_60490 [Pseudonocardia saturnea]|uniref:Uncharacterized protein n=1 Tax=Pseudonocardia saturnea TaxID=33909 RepID=A0ABQ0S7X3_9PSEU|nr:hypothetical protein Pdca_65830 [Pseudonocardia autotrophica]GEC29020.1 hypothetical protein PSA01_60490 [Pseudonocardia saturnea]